MKIRFLSKAIFFIVLLGVFSGFQALPVLAQSQPFFSVEKTARNLTRHDTVWQESITASPGDILQFRITVKNETTDTIKNVTFKDKLPEKLASWGSVKINGSVNTGDVVKGITLGDFTANKTKEVTLEALLSPASEFIYANTILTNFGTVLADEVSPISDVMIISVNKAGGAAATSISTGIDFPVEFPFLISFLAFAVIILFLFFANKLLFPESMLWKKIDKKYIELKSYVFHS